jgi:hypothetical protein
MMPVPVPLTKHGKALVRPVGGERRHSAARYMNVGLPRQSATLFINAKMADLTT